MGLSLLRQGNPLSDPAAQLRLLQLSDSQLRFAHALANDCLAPLRSQGIHVLQVNLGKLCNQTCRHCHVDAGPDRREVMTRETMAACLRALEQGRIPTLDITGGAPEMNPDFCWLVPSARSLGCHVIDRCNLTILTSAGFEHLPEFLANQQVEIVASLPCYLRENVDAQRGDGVFEKSIGAMRQLNALGYGQPDSGLLLNLVYNPLGPTLPPSQEKLETDYHRELVDRYGVVFNRLYTITNMPISRFLDDLSASDRLGEYMQLLIDSYSPAAVAGLMCRTMLSIGWDGRLYDCDFNQMLELGLTDGLPRSIHEFDAELLHRRAIVVGQHCFGCTAGAGSSCQGAIARR
jgi:radical SAM/Cys-rich protein